MDSLTGGDWWPDQCDLETHENGECQGSSKWFREGLMSLENTQQCGINSGAQQSRQWIARKEKSVDPNLSSCVGTSRALRKNSIFVVKALGRDWRFLFLRWGLHLRQERELGRKPLNELRGAGETREKVWWVGGVDIEFAFFFYIFTGLVCMRVYAMLPCAWDIHGAVCIHACVYVRVWSECWKSSLMTPTLLVETVSFSPIQSSPIWLLL